jgi:acetyl-CoA synthetase
MARGRTVVWEPTPEYVERSHLKRFMDRHGIRTYEELIRRSEEDFRWFWRAFIDYAGIEFYQPFQEVCDLSRGLPWPKWFVGGSINVAHNFLDKWADRPETAGRTALVWEGEDGEVRRYTFAELRAEANRFANALRVLGIEKGDRVAIFMPMIPETVIALYGTYKAGAVAVPLFSGFGPEAVALRLRDVEARAVVTADGFYRGGQVVPLKATLDKALEGAPSVRSVIVAERLGRGADWIAGRDHRWRDMVAQASPAFETVRTDAEDLCMVSYSSGTTGKPKGIVHVHGGIAVKSAEVGMFIFDSQPDDVSFMITDFGWMMGQLPLFSAHAVAGPLVIYEGSLVYPHPGRVFELVQKHRISFFGAPATALRLLKAYADPLRSQYDLSSLRILAHTGEPIDEDTWRWYFSWAGGRAPVINGSGGTEVFAEIIASTVMQPLKPTCLGVTPAVGARVVDEQGNPVPPGTPGYLVFTLPQPAQTRGFWKDPQRYLETYFPLGEHLWWHGDMVVVDEDGFWFHLGRADDVIKVAGRRTGPGEIEDVLNSHPGVLESAVIGVPHPIKGQVLVAFVVARPGASPSSEELRQHIVKTLGKPYELAELHFVPDLPKTRTQKVMRRLIRQRFLNEPLGDVANLMNPQALDFIPVRTEKGDTTPDQT